MNDRPLAAQSKRQAISEKCPYMSKKLHHECAFHHEKIKNIGHKTYVFIYTSSI